MLFIELHVLVIFKNMLTKPIETSSLHLTNMVHNCSAFNDHIMLFTLPDVATNTTIVSKELNLHNAVINDVKTLNKSNKWGRLQFLEAYYIKILAPGINFGLKT